MWVFTTDGFFSAVEDRTDHSRLIVRTRARKDIEGLADWLRQHGAKAVVKHTPDHDYAYRVFVAKDVFATYLTAATRAIDYDNFKHAVVDRQGPGRADIYLDVWATMLALQIEGDL